MIHHVKSRSHHLLSFSNLFLCPTAASAQPEDGAGLDGDTPTETSAVDTALDMYWAQKREIKSIQKRLFLKEARNSF